MPVSVPLPSELLPFLCLDLQELRLLSCAAIWTCDVLAAQDESCPVHIPLQICSAGSKSTFACPWCDCASNSQSCCTCSHDCSDYLHALCLIRLELSAFLGYSAPSLSESVKGLTMCSYYARFDATANAQMNQILHPNNFCRCQYMQEAHTLCSAAHNGHKHSSHHTCKSHYRLYDCLHHGRR